MQIIHGYRYRRYYKKFTFHLGSMQMTLEYATHTQTQAFTFHLGSMQILLFLKFQVSLLALFGKHTTSLLKMHIPPDCESVILYSK
jgi:hypothetical protein